MLPERSSNASALVQSKSQVRRPLRYRATGVQTHPILVTVTACRLWPTSAPKRRPAIDPKRAFTTLFHSNSRNTTAVLSSGSPWTEESQVKTATRLSLFHAHITSLFLEWKVLTSACSTSSDLPLVHSLGLGIGWDFGTDYQEATANQLLLMVVIRSIIIRGRKHHALIKYYNRLSIDCHYQSKNP